MGDLGKVIHIHALGDGRFSEAGLQDLNPGLLVGERNVDQLIETPWTQDCGVDNVWSVCSADYEDVFLGSHTVHFC